MTRKSAFVACLFALVAGNALAQSFPSKPITMICPFAPTSAPDEYLRTFAQIASKYLAQAIIVETKTGGTNTLGPATMASTARPDGYTLSQLPVEAFRVPHIQRVSWNPVTDFTYIIGLAGITVGVVVKSDSEFKSLKDLLEFAKANPGKLSYSGSPYGQTGHLVMEELGIKTGVKFLRVPTGDYPQAAKALIEGRIQALSSFTAWGRNVDAGDFHLLVTFGESRSRWNAPTARELGLDILAYAPFGIVGPKGMDPKVTKRLHDAFNRVLDDPEYGKLLTRLDMVDWYKSSEDYAEWAVDQFRFQRALIERTIGLGRGFRD